MTITVKKELSANRNPVIALALIVILVIILRLPSLEEPLDNDSGATAYHARLILQGEPLYSTHHSQHHLPGKYYVYWISFLLFGDRAISIKLFLIPWVIVCGFFLYLLGIKISSHIGGLLAALFFSIISSHVLLNGMNAATEMLANLPIIAGVYFAFKVIDDNAESNYFWAGFLGSICLMFKIIYLTPLLLGLFIIVAKAFQERGGQGVIGKFTRRILFIGTGFMIPSLLFITYFAYLGLLDRVWLVFQLGINYVQEKPAQILDVRLPLFFIFPTIFMAINNLPVLVFGFGGSLRLIRRALTNHNEKRIRYFVVVIWLLISFMQAGIMGIGLSHYILLVVPPLALISGYEIVNLYQAWRAKHEINKYASVAAGSLICMVILHSGIINNAVYWHYFRYKLGLENYEAFLTQRLGTGTSHLRVNKVAQYIRCHTATDDRVYYWGWDMQFYYLADRRAPIDIIWPNYVSATGPPERIFAPETKYIVIRGSEDISSIDWLRKGLENDYVLDVIINGDEIYRRADK